MSKENQEQKVEEKVLDTAADVTKQLITLATGVVTVFAAVFGLVKGVPLAVLPFMFTGVALEILSVIFGLWTQGAIVASLSKKKKFDVVYGTSVQYLAVTQWAFFFLGLAALSLSITQLPKG